MILRVQLQINETEFKSIEKSILDISDLPLINKLSKDMDFEVGWPNSQEIDLRLVK